MNLVIVDYGSGNLCSVENALRAAVAAHQLPQRITITACADTVAAADYVVLPGVGAFADCRAGLAGLDGMLEALNEAVLVRAVPFLGICVGMQLMAEKGDEGAPNAPNAAGGAGGTRGNKTTQGFGWIKGVVSALDPYQDGVRQGVRLKVPHIGWNELIIGSSPLAKRIFAGLGAAHRVTPSVYFLHSYHLTCADSREILATSAYGGHIVGAVGRDNLVGLQFHPEKSQAVGQTILKNWLNVKL